MASITEKQHKCIDWWNHQYFLGLVFNLFYEQDIKNQASSQNDKLLLSGLKSLTIYQVDIGVENSWHSSGNFAKVAKDYLKNNAYNHRNCFLSFLDIRIVL